jgi:4-amino-4-deoxy-L-arabinose transferase-like glycosyltransferase
LSKRVPWFPIALGLLCLAAVALELYTMRDGPAVRGDSVRYVMGARNLLAGNGFSRLSGGGEVFPETGFAPLLSYVLAALGLAGIDMYAGARALNAVLFGASLFMAGTMIATAARSPWIGLLSTVFLMTAPNVVEWHAWLMSEAVFIFLMLLALLSLVLHVQSGRWEWLLLSALAAGMASLARYAGIALIPAGALTILFWGKGARRDRLVRAVIFGAVASLPFVLWMVRNAGVGGAGLANRQLRYHAFRPDVLRLLLFEPTRWLLPQAVILPRAVRGGVALLLFLGGPLLFLRRIGRWDRASLRDEKAVLPLALLLVVPMYVAILVFNSLFLDAGTTLGAVLRYLTPLFVLVVMLEVTTYAIGFPTGRLRRPMAVLLAVLAVVLLAANFRDTWVLARDSSSQLGFTKVRESWGGLAARLSASTTILTDNPEMVYYLIDRPAYAMPIKFDQYQQAFRADFQQQLDLARARLEAGAVLVIFGDPSEEEAEVVDRLDVAPLNEFEGAAVYGYAE